MSTIKTMRHDARRRLRREIASAVVLVAVICALLVLVCDLVTNEALTDSEHLTGSALCGFLCGLAACAAVATAKQIFDLRRALADDTELRRLRAREEDELTLHMEREVSRTFVHLMPALAAVAALVASEVSFEAVAASLATTAFFSVAILAVKLYYKRRYRAGGDGDSE